MICTKEKQLRRVVEYQFIHYGQLPQTREDRLFAQRIRLVTYMKVYDNMKKQLGAKVYKRFITTNARPWRFRAIGKWLFAFGGRYQTAVLTNIAYGRMATGAGE